MRPCNIAEWALNTFSLLLSEKRSSHMLGFFAICNLFISMICEMQLQFDENKPGVYNIAPDDYIGFQKLLELQAQSRYPSIHTTFINKFDSRDF